jgi:hypothetical protein
MAVDGIWRVEMWGPYGWEAVSTAFLHAGDYRAGSDKHFALGRYSEANGRLKVEVTVTNYGDGSAFFGKNEPVFRVNLSGEINGPTVTGEASDVELKYSIPIRMVKVGDL